MTRTALMQCDKCHRKISTASIIPETKQQGEYEVLYFRCPMCGAKFLSLTTDKEARKLLKQVARKRREVELAIKMKQPRSAIQKKQSKTRELSKQATERCNELREIGQKIMQGEQLDDGEI